MFGLSAAELKLVNAKRLMSNTNVDFMPARIHERFNVSMAQVRKDGNQQANIRLSGAAGRLAPRCEEEVIAIVLKNLHPLRQVWLA